MPEEIKEIVFVPVPLHIVQKEARNSRAMKNVLAKFAKDNNIPGSSKVFEVSTDHNKAYELEAAKAKLEKEKAEIEKAELVRKEKLDKLKAEVDKTDSETQKVKNAADNKKRN